MRSTADVVIIGAGVVGASIAWHLTEMGCRNVVLLERESQPGTGSTSKSMGGVRAQFALEADIRMSLFSIPFFRDFARITGQPSGYRAQGYLFLATNERQMDALRVNVAQQRNTGLDAVRLVTTQEALAMVPQLETADILGGSFCPTDGFVDPHSVTTGFLRAALDRGAELLRETEVTGLEVDGRGVAGVRTSQGSIASRIVVNAAGPWAKEIAAMAGIDLPVVPLRRTLVPTERFDKVSHDAPMTVDLSTGFHFRPEGLGFLFAWADPEDATNGAFIEKILNHAARRVPAFAEVQVNPSRAWSGFYEMTPDHHPILGRSPVEGFYLANGFSGHGVMHSPATGKILADLILTGRTELIDAGIFDYGRFAEGRMIHEGGIL